MPHHKGGSGSIQRHPCSHQHEPSRGKATREAPWKLANVQLEIPKIPVHRDAPKSSVSDHHLKTGLFAHPHVFLPQFLTFSRTSQQLCHRLAQQHARKRPSTRSRPRATPERAEFRRLVATFDSKAFGDAAKKWIYRGSAPGDIHAYLCLHLLILQAISSHFQMPPHRGLSLVLYKVLALLLILSSLQEPHRGFVSPDFSVQCSFMIYYYQQ